MLLDGQWAIRDSAILFFGLVGGVAGAVGIRVVRRRRHLYFTIGVVAAAARARLADSRPDPGMGHDHDHRQRIPRRAHVARQRVAGDDRDADRRVHHPDHHRPHAARALRSRPAAAPAPGARGARHLGAQSRDGQSLRVRLQHHRRERPARPGRLLLPRHRQAGGTRATSWRTRAVGPTRTTS